MKALVTGGGGFLGKRVTEMLLARGDTVRVFGRHTYPEVEKLGAECVVGDLRNPADVNGACTGVDTVFHVAAVAGVWGARRDFFEINVKGTANVIQACLDAKIDRLVYTSSPSVAIGEDDIEGGDESLPYPEHYLAVYPESKARAEKMVLDANGWEMVIEEPDPNSPGGIKSYVKTLRSCALRPHLIWGPGDPHLIPRIVAAASAGKLRRVGDGTNKVDVTYVDNAAQAHLQAADALAATGAPAGKAYFIGDPEPVVLWDWINALLARLDVPPITRGISYPAARKIGAVLECVHTVFPFLGEPRMTRFVATQLAKSHHFSHDRARRDFGYVPEINNATGLDRCVEWLRTSGDV